MDSHKKRHFFNFSVHFLSLLYDINSFIRQKMANSFSLMTTSIGQVLHVSNVIQVIVLYKKIVTILIGVLLVMISYFDPPWTFYSLVPSFWTFFWPYDDHLVVSNWNQKKTFYKKLKNMKVFGVKKILGDEKIRERKREKKMIQYTRNCVGLCFLGL